MTWLGSYLAQRSEAVVFKEAKSTPLSISSGVPQGSVLSPLLFSACLSPISRLIDSFHLSHHIYADDISLFLSFDPTCNPLKTLNDCTLALSNWLMSNGLLLNPLKSEVLWVGTKPQIQASAAFNSDLRIAGIPVGPSDKVKVVGVIFDSNLSFSQHMSEVCRVVNFHLRALAHIRKYLDKHTANTLAACIIGSRIDYCNCLFAGLSDSSLLRLQRLQNRAAYCFMHGASARITLAPSCK